MIGAAIVTKHVIEVMKKNSPDRPNGRGSIVMFGSISSFIGQENLAAYSATKAANVQVLQFSFFFPLFLSFPFTKQVVIVTFLFIYLFVLVG